MIEKLKSWWWVLGVVGCLIIFGSRLYAMWQTPEEVDKLSKTVNQYVVQQEKYMASQEQANKDRDYLIKLMVEERLRGN